MALVCAAAFGPTIAEVAGYDHNYPTGFTFVTTPALPTSAAPYWLKHDAAANDVLLWASDDAASQADLSTLTYNWLVCRALYVTAGYTPVVNDLGAGVVTADDLGFALQCGTAGTWRIRTSEGVTNHYGATNYTPPFTLQILLEMTTTTKQIWVSLNGATPTLEVNISGTFTRPSASDLAAGARLNGLGAGKTGHVKQYNGVGAYGSDTQSDAPGLRQEAFLHYPDGQVASYDDYTGVGDTTNKYLNWDDWAAGGVNDGATTRNVGIQAIVKQASTLTGHSYVEPTLLGVRCIDLALTPNAGKNIPNSALVRTSAGGDVEKALPSPGVDMIPFHAWFLGNANAPGGTWNQSTLDDLQAGSHRTAAGDASQLRVTALACEGFAINAKSGTWWDDTTRPLRRRVTQARVQPSRGSY